MNPAHERMLKHFRYDHLPAHLQAISQPICELATQMATQLTESSDPAEVTTRLRKLLESKDCFVRAMVQP